MFVETSLVNDKILFLLAAPSGAGKSTLLKFGFDKLAKLVGPEFQDKLLETKLNQSGLEFKSVDEARNRQSYFHAVHVPFLRAEKTAKRSVLIHVDIYNVLRDLAVNSNYITNQQLNELTKRRISVNEVRKNLELLDKRTNDFLLKNFLRDPLFKQFGGIVNITLHCDYIRHQSKLLERNGQFGFGHSDPYSPKIHSEIYDCWKRNISSLKVLADFDIALGPYGYQNLS